MTHGGMNPSKVHLIYAVAHLQRQLNAICDHLENEGFDLPMVRDHMTEHIGRKFPPLRRDSIAGAGSASNLVTLRSTGADAVVVIGYTDLYGVTGGPADDDSVIVQPRHDQLDAVLGRG